MPKNQTLKNLALVLLLTFSVKSFSQTSPVTVSTIIGYPPSIYLPDYYVAGSNKLTANLILNDFNEISRDVYLKITIESPDVRISTKPDYYPKVPLTLYPGEMQPISGDGLEEYLNYNNIVLEGISYTEMISRGGRLPEGFYNFCIEAYDYETRRLLSNSSCVVSHLAQHEPPKFISPEKGKVVGPGAAQNIVFSWLNEAPVDQTNLSYKFMLYELIDPTADPMQAITNKKVTVVHEEETTTPIFNYNSSHPLLETGKTYVYTVQAISYDGKAMFKNNGVSEPSYFFYGYPGNGKIELLSPENQGALKLTKEKTFSWTAPDNLLAGQTYTYEIRIAKADSTRPHEEVLAEDSILYSLTTGIRTGSPNFYQNVKAHFPTGENFVWQVTAFTGEQEIAKSEISIFGGPPCILDFIGANEYITVTFTEGCDINNLTGTGTVEINENGDTHEVWFNNVRVEKDGVQYYLRGGEVLGDFGDLAPIKLNPNVSRNGDAFFYPDSFKITRYDFMMKGHIEWSFPHAVDQDEAPIMYSDTTWLNFANYHLIGPLKLQDSTSFDLLDPMNFTIDFAEGSKFYIRGDDEYFLEFIGNITFPESVHDPEENTVVLPFGIHNQLFNIYSNEQTTYQTIHVANRTTLNLIPQQFVFDFDNDASPGFFSENPMWRGFYIQSGTYTFEGDYKFSKQFASSESLKTSYDFEAVASDFAYVLADGLYIKSSIDFDDDNKLFFNTFPAALNLFRIDVAASRTNEGQITGDIVIPLLSDTEDFPFTCNLSQYGFQPGFLDEEIENKTFAFNKEGGEQQLALTFNRGYFADNERLETTVTIEWPFLGLSFEKIPAFRIWGNYDIGFGLPNGAFALAQQMQTKVKGFEITIDGIGAGRQGNLYTIGTTAKIVMAKDVAGEAGPPIINLYSIFESSKIDENYILGNSPDYSNVNSVTQGEGYQVDENIGAATEGMATVGDIEAIMADYEQKAAETEAKIEALKPKPTVGKQPPSDNLYADFADLIPGLPSEAIEDPVGNMTMQELIQLIEFIAPFLEPEQQEKVLDFKELLVSFSPDEIKALIEKLGDIRGLLNNAIKSMIDGKLAEVTNPIKEKVDGLNLKIETTIMNGSDSLVAFMGKGIDVVINGFVEGAIELIDKGPFEDPSKMINGINKLSISSRLALKTELKRTVSSSVHKNIVVPATGIVDTVLYTGTVLYLSESLSSNAANFITDPNFGFSDINIDVDGMVSNTSDLLRSKLNFEYFKGRITSTVEEAICGFNWDSVSNVFFRDLTGAVLEDLIVGKVTNVVTDKLGETAGGIAGGLAANVELDFSNIGDKLKSGDLRGIVKFDPSYIKIVTPTVDLEGYVNMIEDDPIWGDSWQASLNATIKVPSEWQAFAKYINGSKPKQDTEGMTPEEKLEVETFKYWFVEIGARKLSVQLGPLPVILTGADGRIYHHMMRQPDLVTYYPHDSIRYGAGLRFYMVDASSGGSVADFNIGLELELVKGGFILEMNGGALIANEIGTDKNGERVIVSSKIISEGFLRYNSVDKHFLGNLTAEAKASPLLCASGGMIIDISKDWWQFAIGTREKPITIALLCRDTIFRGWFDINKNGLDLGLMANIHLDIRSPWINLGIAKYQGWAAFGFDFESELVISWNPDFAIQRARVYIDIYAGIGVDYKLPPLYKKINTFTIAAVNLGGELLFETAPTTHLYGEVHGSITILNIKAGVSLEADINF